MSSYTKGEYTQRYDQQIENARDLLGDLRQYPEFAPFESLIGRYSARTGSCEVKLVASCMPNDLICMSTWVTYEELIYYINKHIGGAETENVDVLQRIRYLSAIFDIVRQRIDLLDPVFHDFLNQINKIEYFDIEEVPAIDANVRRRFCSFPGSSVSAWYDSFNGLPDIERRYFERNVTYPNEVKKAKKAVVHKVGPNVLGRFLDGFLCHFVERYFDFGGSKNAHDVGLNDETFLDAVVKGLYAVENLDWKEDVLKRTAWMR